MSRLFEGLHRTPIQKSQLDMVLPDMAAADRERSRTGQTTDVSSGTMPEANIGRGTAEAGRAIDIEKSRPVMVQCSTTSRLVSWTDPNSLGAEKFRALAVRLSDMRSQLPLKSVQVTSSVVNEGKSFVAANLATTLAKYSGSRTLLVEGDLHRPSLASMFGLRDLPGLSDWWFGRDPDISNFLVRFQSTGLWMLPAGKACDRPSDVLHSARLAGAFTQLAEHFDWIIVDSTPMLPVIDANLWSRLVDGTLLVVREGLAPLKALRSGLQSLDHPNLIGVVVNEASEFNQTDYNSQYYSGYSASKRR